MLTSIRHPALLRVRHEVRRLARNHRHHDVEAEGSSQLSEVDRLAPRLDILGSRIIPIRRSQSRDKRIKQCMEAWFSNLEAAIVPHIEVSLALHVGFVWIVLGDQVWCVARADGCVAVRIFDELGVWAVDLLEGFVVVEDQHVGSDAEDRALVVSLAWLDEESGTPLNEHLPYF
jgi:hypothetical protein